MTTARNSDGDVQQAEPDPAPEPPAGREWISTERVKGCEPPPAGGVDSDQDE